MLSFCHHFYYSGGIVIVEGYKQHRLVCWGGVRCRRWSLGCKGSDDAIVFYYKKSRRGILFSIYIKKIILLFLCFFFYRVKGITILLCLKKEIDRFSFYFTRGWRWIWRLNILGNDGEIWIFYIYVCKRRRMCVL